MQEAEGAGGEAFLSKKSQRFTRSRARTGPLTVLLWLVSSRFLLTWWPGAGGGGGGWDGGRGRGQRRRKRERKKHPETGY